MTRETLVLNVQNDDDDDDDDNNSYTVRYSTVFVHVSPLSGISVKREELRG